MSMTLPTPPRTAHKDKENLPPTPLTPNSSPNFRTPRIVWSQENLHHAYTNQIRPLPSSRRAKEPSKSILKKASHPLMPLTSPEQPSREVTPEPADPLHHPLYLNSPVTTLVTSLLPGGDAKISLTDLTEAYSLLSARLKTKTHAMLDMCGPIPALEPLREHADKLVVAFHRDIQRAFVNPQGSPPPSGPSPWSSPSSAGSVQKRGYTEQEVKHARDLCNLSHAALRCFSNISVVPVLCSIFNPQLGEILTDVLAIPLASSLPTPNARKTCQIAVWTLQVQRLPTAVLAPAADRIVYALRRGIDGELGREGKKGAISDGLKAVAMLASYQPAIFLPPLAEVLPSVLAHLTSQNLALRIQAAHAILSLSHALAYLPTPPQTLRVAFSQTISNYLTEQHQTRKTPQDVSPLGKAFRVCLEVDVPVHAAQSPMWALSVTAAVIVLSGGTAFTDARTIKFVLGHLQTAMAVKRTTVRATAGLVWRALVWACVKLDDSEYDEEQKDAGWKVVRQILDGNIGISVVAALIGQKARKDGRVPQALELVRTMIKKGGRTCEEAVNILERLLSGVGSGLEERHEKEWVDEKLLVEPLFNGTLLQAEWKGVVAHVKEALGRCVVVSDVRPLHEDEVTEHWDMLFAIWKDGVERAPLGEDGEVPSALLGAWQALLLTQAQLTQGYEHLTSAPAFVSYLTELLQSFLTDQSLEWSLDAGAPSWSSQPLKLGFVRNLWSVARNVFAAPTLADAAQTLLYEVLKHEYLLGQIEVREAWAALCAELVLAGVPGLVRELWQLQDQDQGLEKEVKRGLWRVVSQRWVEDAGSSDGAIELLRAPFAAPMNWEFDQYDLELWIRLVNCALLAASVRKVSPNTVLDTIAGEIGVDHNRTSLYAALPHLLSGVDMSALERSTEPQYPYVLLTLANDVLAASYPPPGAGDTSMLLSIMEGLTEITKTVCKELLAEFLTQVQNGTSIWIQDEQAVLTDEEYNQQVIPFYATSLEALKAVPPSLESLRTLSPLLVSAFHRIPEPATGPSAFQKFWIETYPQLGKLEGHFPEELKPIVRSIQETMCVEEVVSSPGFSLETQTQDTEPVELPSVISDSLEGDELQLSDNATLRGILDALYEESEIRGPQNDDDQPYVNVVDSALREEGGDMSNLQMNNSTGSHWPRAASSEANQGVPDVSSCVSAERDDAPSLAPSHISESQPSAVSIHDQAAVQSIPSQRFVRASGNFVTSMRLGYDGPLASKAPKGSEPGPDLSASAVGKPYVLSTAMRSPQSVKEEDLDIDPDMAMMMDSSQESILSQSKSSGSPLGKRRRSRILSQSNKKRKTAPYPGVEIINISDDEDSEQVALDVSIVVAPIKRRRSLETQFSTVPRGGQPSTPKSMRQVSIASTRRRIFEAVELPRMDDLKGRRNMSIGSSPDSSPCKRKTITRTLSNPKLWHPKSESDMTDQSPSKRRRISDLSGKGKQKAIDDWNGETPLWSTFSVPSGTLDPASDDADMQETPMQSSDVSISSSKLGQISASHITSPLLRRSRSEAYDSPSDDMPASSSPLKQAMARRLQRARTVPVVLGAPHRDTIARIRPRMARTPSEEFLALEHAHVVVTSGASKMELQELLDASKMINQINGALGNEMARKLSDH